MIKPKKSIQSLTPYEVPLFPEEYELKLDANENFFGCSPFVQNALNNICVENISRYPHYGELTEEIAKYINVKSEQIKVTNGADEALYSLMQIYLEDGDTMLTVTPSFSMPKLYAKIVGANVVEIPYKKKWEFPLEDFLNEIKNNETIKIITLTSPNNPTGECISENIEEQILKAAKDKLVIFDETYAGYCSTSMIPKINKYDNLAVVKSFSKDFALAGLRVGYIISHEERIKVLKTVISPYSVNAAACIAAKAALSDIEYFEKVKKEIEKSKQILSEGFKNLGFEVYPSEANFILINAREKSEYVNHTLLKHGIGIRKFSSPDMDGLLRITAPNTDNAKKIIKLLQPKKTLIFDMDGVLADVSSSYRKTIQETFKHFSNKNIEQEEITKAKNLGGLNNDWDLTLYLLEKEGITIPREELIEVFEKIYFNDGNGLILNEKFLLDINLLKEISKKYNLAIFTGRPKNEALFALKKVNAERYFYPIITMDSLPKDKQKPDKLGIDIIKNSLLSTEIYYFGDTKDDMTCANSAEVIAIGVIAPQNKVDETKKHLEENGAKKVLTTINELLSVTESN